MVRLLLTLALLLLPAIVQAQDNVGWYACTQDGTIERCGSYNIQSGDLTYITTGTITASNIELHSDPDLSFEVIPSLTDLQKQWVREASDDAELQHIFELLHVEGWYLDPDTLEYFPELIIW